MRKSWFVGISSMILLGALYTPVYADMLYTVQPGDGLWKIAQTTGSSVEQLAVRNNISNVNLLYAGQTLWIPSSALQNRILTLAHSMLGTPYVWGGNSPTGFDCSGLIWYVYNKTDINMPRTSSEQWQIGTPVSQSQLQVGDVVFFQNTYKSGISHDGIYISNGLFIESSSSKGQVIIAHLYYPYFQAHYAGARRLF